MAGLFWSVAVALPLFSYVDGIAPGVDRTSVVVSVMLLVYSTTRLAGLIGGARVRIVSGVVWMFIYISMSVVPLAQAHTGLYPFLIAQRYVLPAQVLTLIAVIAFDLGQVLAVRIRWSKRKMKDGPRRLSVKRLQWLTVLAIAASAYYVVSVGGPATFFASRRDLGKALVSSGLRSQESQVGSALVQTAGTVPVFIALVAWSLVLLRGRDRRTLEAYLTLTALLAANVVVNNPIANTRYWVLTVIVGFAYAIPSFSPRIFRIILTLGILAALTLFPYSDYFRNTEGTRSAVDVRSVGETISTKDYDQSIMTGNGIWWVENSGYTFGGQLAGAALFWVPRTFWADKPYDTGLDIGRALGGPNTNLSSPLWLEFWVDFGPVGMTLLFVGVGFGARRADDAFAAGLDAARSYVLVADVALPLLAGFSFILLRGPLIQAMPRLTVILAVCWFLNARTPISSAPQGLAPRELSRSN
jgi:hypothetical protein